MFDGDPATAIGIGEQMLPNVTKLRPSTQTRFYQGIAKAYEDNGQPESAITYYTKVVAAAPDYYVAHRALGYLYARPLTEIYQRYQSANGASRSAIMLEYKAAAAKVLPHLEKAQACDPDDDTLQLIHTIYKNMSDEQGLASLDARLKQLAAKCQDLLPD